MKDNTFFRPTPVYKEFMILDLMEKNKRITQREISETVGISVSMVNNYLETYEKRELITRKYHSTKNVEYFVTKKGVESRKLLNIMYLKSSRDIYLYAKKNIAQYLHHIVEKGFEKILLYGAGEVAEIILDVIQNDKYIPITVSAVIDDDPEKIGKEICEIKIISRTQKDDFHYDGILISTYTNHNTIKRKLLNTNYDKEKILQFFD